MTINKNEITKEMLEKAMQCKTADELMALAKSEAYFAEFADIELDEKALRNVAGGSCVTEGTSCWTLSN